MAGSALGPRCPAQAAPRGHGGAGCCAEAARQDRQGHRCQHGGRGLLHLCDAAGRRAGALCHRRPQGRSRSQVEAEDGEGLVGTIAKEAIGLNLAEAQDHRPSSICPRQAKKSITPSSACRSCARARSSACWWCRTARGATKPKRKKRRCRPPPWCWPRSSPQASCARLPAKLPPTWRMCEAMSSRRLPGRGRGAWLCGPARTPRRHPQSHRRECARRAQAPGRRHPPTAHPCGRAARRVGCATRHRIFGCARDHPHVRP